MCVNGFIKMMYALFNARNYNIFFLPIAIACYKKWSQAVGNVTPHATLMSMFLVYIASFRRLCL